MQGSIQTNRRLKIAIISDSVNAAAGAGGVVSSKIFVDYLRQRHDVCVVSADSDNEELKLKSLRPSFINVVKNHNFTFAIPNRKILRKVFAEVDIVHIYFPFWLAFVALDEANKAKKPIVTSFHIQPENILYNLNIRSEWLNKKIYQFWIKKFWGRSDLVICPSQFAVNKLKSHHLDKPALAISNGVVLDAIATKHERGAKYKGYFLIVMLGRLTAEKEQHILIEAIRRSKHSHRIKLVIAGLGQNKNKLIQLAKALPNFAEIGFISHETKKQLLATADLFVHCSSVELEGMAVLEAISNGLPALVAEGSETAASYLTLPQLRFPVGNVSALQSKLDWLIENPNELLDARKHFQASAPTLNIDNSIQQIEEVYQLLTVESY